MLRKTIIAMAGTTVGVTTTLVGNPAPAAADPGIQAATCTSGTLRAARTTTGTIAVPSNGVGTGDYDCVLGPGSTGDGVRFLQHALSLCHHKNLGPSGVDGSYGTFTRDAVRAVQAENGIPVDGVYGPQTKLKVRWPIINPGGSFVGCERVA